MLTLASAASTVLPLGDGFGLHPKMPGFKRLWDEKRMAIVQGVGFANPNFSHFQSMDIWQSGIPASPGASGWLGRWLDATGADPLRAVAVGPTVPVALTGQKVQAVAIPAGPLRLPGDGAEQGLFASWRERQRPVTNRDSWRRPAPRIPTSFSCRRSSGPS